MEIWKWIVILVSFMIIVLPFILWWWSDRQEQAMYNIWAAENGSDSSDYEGEAEAIRYRQKKNQRIREEVCE